MIPPLLSCWRWDQRRATMPQQWYLLLRTYGSSSFSFSICQRGRRRRRKNPPPGKHNIPPLFSPFAAAVVVIVVCHKCTAAAANGEAYITLPLPPLTCFRSRRRGGKLGMKGLLLPLSCVLVVVLRTGARAKSGNRQTRRQKRLPRPD